MKLSPFQNSNTPTARRLLLAGCGALLGAVLFFLCYGFAGLDVTNDAWILCASTDHDVMQHYAGWLFYRDAPLTFPPGSAVSMQYPSGVGGTLSYTDSVPLAGIFFRLLSSVLPATFQYFGVWVLLCYALTGAGAALLLSLFLQNTAAGNACVLLGAVLFVLSPIMADRAFRHTALTSQFFIVFSLYFYFLDAKQGHRWRLGWPVLAVLAMTVHPYFLPMIFAVLFADLASLCLAKPTRGWRTCAYSAGYLVLCAALALGVGALIGAFSAPAAADNSYGFWAMNGNALWNPTSVGCVWSPVLQNPGMTNGNIDGFNYLGLGVLLSGAAALVWTALGCLRNPDTRKVLAASCKRHWVLAAVCGALTAFSLSHVVTLNAGVLFTLPLPAFLVRLCSVFRASGRMFWVVNYLLLLCVVFFWARRSGFILKKLGPAAGAVCLAAVLCVQAVDLAPGFADKRAIVQNETPADDAPVQSAVWDALAGQYAHIFSLDNPLRNPYHLALWAAKNGMTTNDPFPARYDAAAHSADISAATERLRAGEYDADTLYFTCDIGRFQIIAEALAAADADVTCAQLDELWYAVIPNKPGVSLPAESDDFVLYPHFPLMLANYTDTLWTYGVLDSDPRTVLLYDSAVTAAVLDGADSLVCEGKAYRVLEVDNQDAGWLMVTLEIADASMLHGKELTRGE